MIIFNGVSQYFLLGRSICLVKGEKYVKQFEGIMHIDERHLGTNFSIFFPYHREIAFKMVALFMDISTKPNI